MLTLKEFSYKFDKGPVVLERINDPVLGGNCRLVVQDYHYLCQSIYLTPEAILCPNSYNNTGVFITEKTESINQYEQFFQDAKKGDIIFAEKYRNKNSEIIHRPKSSFSNIDDWMIALHTAIYIGSLDNAIIQVLPDSVKRKNLDPSKAYIWHATALVGGTCLWSIEKFIEFYNPVALKRVN